jgi:hypothetical protein
MISLREFIWLVKTWKFNCGKVAARCLCCGVLDWWPKTTPPDRHVCYYCFISEGK